MACGHFSWDIAMIVLLGVAIWDGFVCIAVVCIIWEGGAEDT